MPRYENYPDHTKHQHATEKERAEQQVTETEQAELDRYHSLELASGAIAREASCAQVLEDIDNALAA